MHRVELKALSLGVVKSWLDSVPNAPCGVESLQCSLVFQNPLLQVPNAPCGVESNLNRHINKQKGNVPNAPCGVER